MPGSQILHRVVGAMVSELHLDRLCTGGETEQLVAQADAERRHAGIDDVADRVNGVVARLGVAVWTPSGAISTSGGRRPLGPR